MYNHHICLQNNFKVFLFTGLSNNITKFSKKKKKIFNDGHNIGHLKHIMLPESKKTVITTTSAPDNFEKHKIMLTF